MAVEIKKYKAKPIQKILDELMDEEAYGYEWLRESVDENYKVSGYLVGTNDGIGYILGNIIEADTDYIIPEFWIPVDLDTLEEI